MSWVFIAMVNTEPYSFPEDMPILVEVCYNNWRKAKDSGLKNVVMQDLTPLVDENENRS